MGHPGTFNYVRCSGCGLAQISAVPKNIDSFYAAYQVHQPKGIVHAFVRTRLMAGAYLRVRKMHPAGKLLDFGCGDGWFLNAARRDGWETAGFEVNQTYADAMQKKLCLPIASSLSAVAEKSGRNFDWVTLHFVLEHLAAPIETISELAGFLRPGGRIFITVPNIASLEFKFFGRLWHGLDAPRHISFFEKKHIATLAEKAGLSLVDSRGAYVPNTLAGSLATVFGKRFSYRIFAASILPCFILCRHRNPGNIAFTLQKK